MTSSAEEKVSVPNNLSWQNWILVELSEIVKWNAYILCIYKLLLDTKTIFD